MAHVVESSTGGPLPQDAMRRIVEAVDTWRGQPQVFVVFETSPPYEIVSLHATEAAAQAVANAQPGRSYFGPVTPRPAASSSLTVLKKVGCMLSTLGSSVSSVVLLDAADSELARFSVNPGTRAPDSESDLEALFFTPSGIDKFLIPYLTRVFGADYAASRREEWITD